eukprot:s3962_g2.t1
MLGGVCVLGLGQPVLSRKAFKDVCLVDSLRAHRCSLSRASRIDQDREGKYILAYSKHFVAFRILDGAPDVNFSHRSHEWHPCKLVQNTSRPLMQQSGRYLLNQALLDGVFEIGRSVPANRPLSQDSLGGSGSSCASHALPLHSEPVKILDQKSISPAEAQEIERRISVFEGVCCDWKQLLCSKPDLWFQLPCPFSQNGVEWDSAMAAAVRIFRATPPPEDANADADDLSQVDKFNRVDKRLRVYIGTLRKNAQAILEQPEWLKCAPNPCDSSEPKRSWEKKMLALRQVWRDSTTNLDGAAEARPDSSDGGHGVVSDVIGAGLDPAAFLQHRFLFGRALCSQSERSRVWSQLRDFHAAMLPLSDTLNKFPFTFWILPSPFDVDEQENNWQIRLECCCLFLWLVKDSKAVHLEALLVAFYWPEIQRQPGLLDMVSTSRLALSQRDRIKKLVRAWLLLHTLSLPVRQQHDLALMPCNLFFRYVQVYRAMHNIQPFKKNDKRTRYIAAFGDVLGGALDDVQVASALTGEHLLSCSIPSELEDDHSFADLVRVEASDLFDAPYYSLDILFRGQLVDDEITWADLGCPKHVELLRKPKVLDWTQEFFEAIEAGDVLAVLRWLKMGQDPNSTVIDSALSTAVRHCHYSVVHTLIKAQANVNYIPPGCGGPLHNAVMHDAELCAALLLRRQADPSLQSKDHACNTPLHLAAVYGDEYFASLMLAHGADPLSRNAYGSSPFTLASSGSVVSLCLEKSFDRIDEATLLQRHLSILVEFGCPRSLWNTSKVFQMEQQVWDADVIGGSMHQESQVEGFSRVSFLSALTGEEICVLPVSQYCTVLLLKQRIALHVGHLPFAIVLLVGGTAVPLDASWATIGFPLVMDVVLSPRTNAHSADLSHAIQSQNHSSIIAALEAGQDPDCWCLVPNTGRNEPVILTAAAAGFFYSVHLLLNGFADPNSMGHDGRSATHVAVLANSPLTMHVLIHAAADIHVQDRQGETPLHYATVLENVFLVKQLVSAGADSLAPDSDNEVPLLVACEADTRAALMDGCWQSLSYLILFLLNAQALADYATERSLRQLCRRLNKFHFRQQRVWDVAGGSSEMAASLEPGTLARVCRNRANALERKRKPLEELKEIDVEALLAQGFSASDVDALVTRRQGAFRRRCWLRLWEQSMPTQLNQCFGKSAGLPKGVRLPLPAEGWTPTNLGPMPSDFMACGKTNVVFDFLRTKNSHERDEHLTFDELSHTYYIDGARVDVSVTGFLAAFQKPFCPDDVIARMQQYRWPRPGYFSLQHIHKAVAFAQQHPPLSELARLLQAQPVDKESICALLQQVPQDQLWDFAKQLLAMTPTEIKLYWKQNGEAASRLGTWAHLQCECILNGGEVANLGAEMACLAHFVKSSERLLAHRTEWSIWATEEKLAGTIDFCAVDSSGCLVLIDWKRSKNLKHKYLVSSEQMERELSHIPNAVGWKYRLQLNVYKYIIEKYYGLHVSKMFVVDIHPDSEQSPFIDDVPDMQADVQAILRARIQAPASAGDTSDIVGGAATSHLVFLKSPSFQKSRQRCAALMGDVCAGSQGEMDFEAQLEEEVRFMEEAGNTQASIKEEATSEHGGQEGDDQDEEDPLAAKVKRRRLMKGAATTAANFQKMFASFEELNQERLDCTEKDTCDNVFNILSRVEKLRNDIRQKFPRWSETLIRMGAAAVSSYSARLGDRMFLGDNAFFLWLAEGERFIRVHQGFCYIYNDNGAFLPYSGTPPQAVLVRVATFFAQLEGVFRRTSPTTAREAHAILASMNSDLAEFPSEECYLEACREAAIWQRVPQDGVPALADAADDEEEEGAHQGRGKLRDDWTIALAKRIWKLCQSVRNDLMHEKLVSLLVEWCETPHAQKPCVSYEDTCVQYDVSREIQLKHVIKSAENDCYVYIPHPLIDPVLATHTLRLQKFYAQTFWANNTVFECCLAAMALAKRGFNVDRCFIGISPGGVGQSLFSLRLDAMLGPNHSYFDPNVWYNEDELRKQVESFARCIVITGQEAPESHKKLHLDLFKKTMSADGIAGRKPYGYTTRMFNVVGWTRLEVNRMLVFYGITKSNFMSVMRRSLVWEPKARFHPESVLKQVHPDHELDGHFLADPTLKQFLASAPASAAGLRIQHAFELEHCQADCVHMIDEYATGGDDFLTEDKMRVACGLPLRVRHLETAAGGVGMLHVSDSQEERDAEDAQYKSLFEEIFARLMDQGLSDLTLYEFKKMFAKGTSERPNATPTVVFEQLQKRNFLQKGCRKGKAKDVLQPLLSCEKKLEEVISCKKCDSSTAFLETMDAAQMRRYLHSHDSRASNVETFKLFLERSVSKLAKRRGRMRPQDQAQKQEMHEQLRKLQDYEKACEHAARICADALPGPSPLRRSRSKAPAVGEVPVSAGSSLIEAVVTYAYTGDREMRCRRYVNGFGAQKCSRRIQSQLFAHTVDLDIQNCCASLALQLLQKLKPKPELPKKAMQALERWVADREGVCSEELKLSEPEGKHLVTAILSGAAPSGTEPPEILQHFQQASIYLRWLACSLLQADYGELEKRSDKPFPGATTFFYLWAAVEDYVLASWCDKIQVLHPKHLSLHFDGVRVNADIAPDMDVFLRDCECHIQKSTGFNVSIRVKTHAHFLELLSKTIIASAIADLPADLERRPNCILCSLWHLCSQADKEEILSMVGDGDSSQNAYADERRHRTYKQCFEVLGFHAEPLARWSHLESGRYLIHSENNGDPRCVAMEVFGEDVHITDGRSQYKASQAFVDAIARKATDFSTMVVFALREEKVNAETLEIVSCFLDLQAGSAEAVYPSGSLSDSSESGEEEHVLIDDEGKPFFQDTLKDSLAEEVASFLQEVSNDDIRKIDAMFRCPFCPFRAFKRLPQLRDHVAVHHCHRKQYVCSGTKQLRIILALYDADCMLRQKELEYLHRSACLLRQQVWPELSAARTSIDKEIRLLLTSSGPKYCNKAAIGTDIIARRVLNLYYDRGFAEVLYRELLIHHSNVKSVWPRLFVISKEQGNPLANLYPTHTRHWWPIVEDVFMSSAVQSLRSNLLLTLERNEEYACVSADATLKVCMALKGQASYREKADVRNSACFGDAEALRRLLTVRGRTGAVLGLVPIVSEKDEFIANALKGALSQNALCQIQFISTDCPTSKLFQTLKTICPNLKCLCLDPIHLAIVYEYAQWRKRTQGSKCLRTLLRKVTAIDPNKTDAAWGPFFEGRNPEPLSRPEEKARRWILDGMPAGAAEKILGRLNSDVPLFCRVTFIETLAAICAKYDGEVSRKVTGTAKEVRKVLWSACAPERLEYLLNNLRIRHSMDARARCLLPTGTTSNEALHSEINAWARQIQEQHRSTLQLKLQILQLGKLLSHNVALCHPPLRQTRDNVILARASCSPLWTQSTWAVFCATRRKAALPLHRQRQAEAAAVREHSNGEGARKKPVRKNILKRTPFTVKRRRSLKSSSHAREFQIYVADSA